MQIDNALIDQALKLKPQEKLLMVELLMQSLDKPDEQIAEIWLQEAERRLHAYQSGHCKGIPVEEVFGEPL